MYFPGQPKTMEEVLFLLQAGGLIIVPAGSYKEIF